MTDSYFSEMISGPVFLSLVLFRTVNKLAYPSAVAAVAQSVNCPELRSL